MTSRNSSRIMWSGLAIALLLCSVPCGAKPAQGSLRYTVMVQKFENKTESPEALGEEWATLLTTKLYEDGHFIVVSEEDMQRAAMNEQARGGSGVTAQGKKTAVRAQMTPAQLLVKGVITHYKAGAADHGGGFAIKGFTIKAGRKRTEIRATLQMIDASTGAVVAAKNFVGVAQARSMGLEQAKGDVKMGEDDNVHAAFEKAIGEIIPWMVQQLPSVHWRGTVVKVDKERIIINRGSREGVSAGDEFIVGESDVVRDPDTGEVIDEVLHERARIKVMKVSERTSVCSVVSGNAGQIVERMAIQYSNES